MIKSLVDGCWAAKLSKDEPYVCWAQSRFLTSAGAERQSVPACFVLGVCVAVGSGTDTSTVFTEGEQDNTCGFRTPSARFGDGAGEWERW